MRCEINLKNGNVCLTKLTPAGICTNAINHAISESLRNEILDIDTGVFSRFEVNNRSFIAISGRSSMVTLYVVTVFDNGATLNLIDTWYELSDARIAAIAYTNRQSE